MSVFRLLMGVGVDTRRRRSASSRTMNSWAASLRCCSTVPAVSKVLMTPSPDTAARRCSASHSIDDR
jgi:hypothetical protein